MDIFAKRLRERAAELQISNAEAARRCGLDERRYSHYVSGIREPNLTTLVRIAEALQTTPNDLLAIGTPRKSSARSMLSDRLASAANNLGDHELEIAIIQTEAVSNRFEKKPRKAKPK